MSWEDASELKVFAGRHCKDLAARVCEHLGMPLGGARTEVFPDGELITHVDEDVRGRDCFVVLSTSGRTGSAQHDPSGSVNDNLIELLIFADSLRRASARRITAVIPYFGYARQDRKERGRTPITAKMVANMITAAGFQRVLTLDLHTAQIQGFFDLPVDHLAAAPIFREYFMSVRSTMGDLVVASPDVGNAKIANMYAEMLDAELAIVHKRRVSGTEVVSNELVGNVQGKSVVLIDDMISTGGTAAEAARVVMEKGAREVMLAATHAVMVGPARERLANSPISRVVTTNSIPNADKFTGIEDMVVELCVSKLFANAIDHIHHNKSVSALFHQYAESKR